MIRIFLSRSCAILGARDTSHIVWVAILLVASTVATSVEASGEADAPRVTDVSLFKNGLGCFTSTGRLPAKSTSWNFSPPLDAVHGSYWIRYDPQNVKLGSVTAAMVDRSERRSASGIGELLRANLGREVELTTTGAIRRGRIVRLLPSALNDAVAAFVAIPAVVIFADGAEQEAIRIEEIKAVRSSTGFDTSFSVTTKHPRITIDYTASSDADFNITQLSHGITWAPAYSLDITSSPSGYLRLQSIVLNEAQDLDHVRMHFISGFPNIAFADVRSPFSLDQSLSSFLESLGSSGSASGRRGGRGGMMAQQMVTMNAYAGYGGDLGMSADDAAEAAGSYAEDLFYYTLEDVSLKKNSRGYYEILSGAIMFEHIYTWDIAQAPPVYGARQVKEVPPEEIWHKLKITNPFRQPLTTAPVLVVSGGKILGQDVLAYTSPKAETRIRITKALDLKAEQSEAEVARQQNSRTWQGSSYDLVTIEGVLTIRNHKAETVKVEVSRQFEGSLIEASHNAKETKLAEGLRRLNPVTRLEWTVDLPAGEKLEIKYRYKVYID